MGKFKLEDSNQLTYKEREKAQILVVEPDEADRKEMEEKWD